MKLRIVAIVAAAFLAAPLVACGAANEVGEKSADQHIAGGQATATASEDGLFDDGRSDVTLKSCKIGDPYDYGDSYAVADLKIKNSSVKVSDYMIEIEVTRPSGDRLATIPASVEKVAPGQTVDTGNGDGEEDGTTDDAVTGKFLCSILSADRSASVE